MNEQEAAALEKLLRRFDGAAVAFGRAGVGETGPVRVTVDGEGVWRIGEDGKAVKQRG
jgi:hypothetical protein